MLKMIFGVCKSGSKSDDFGGGTVVIFLKQISLLGVIVTLIEVRNIQQSCVFAQEATSAPHKRFKHILGTYSVSHAHNNMPISDN